MIWSQLRPALVRVDALVLFGGCQREKNSRCQYLSTLFLHLKQAPEYLLRLKNTSDAKLTHWKSGNAFYNPHSLIHVSNT